jgi:outer membrane lipoprotein LolB
LSPNHAGTRRRGRAVPACLAVLLLLAGCRSLPPPPPETPTGTFAGRFSLSITHSEPGGADRHEVWSGRFALAVGAQTLRLDLVSPLGATLARFETDAHEARLLVPAGGGVRVEHGADAQSLSERVLGWSLPIAGMPDWIAGHPSPERPYRVLAQPADAPGAAGADAGPGAATAPDRFEQDGWTVVVERGTDARAAQRVQMSRPEADASPAVALRVVLDAPALGAAPPQPAAALLARAGRQP